VTKDVNIFRKNLILLVGSIILSITFAEIALRIVLPSPVTWKYPQEDYIYDHEIGHWIKPNQQAFTHDKTVIINSVGIRDSEYSLEAPSGIYRILALGDSQTFGNGLELRDTWPKQLESKINQLGDGIRFEVLNSGLPGSDTWQHEIILNRMISNYHPNSVILAFYVNDVVKRFTPSPSRHDAGNALKNRIIYALKKSVLLLALREALHSIQQTLAPTNAYLRQQALLSGEDDVAIEDGWEQVEESLSTMKKVADNHNIAFMLVSLPRRDQVDGRLFLDDYNKNLQMITEQYKIQMVDLLEPLQRGYKTHNGGLFIPWDGHNSEIANYIIAEEISKVMLINLDQSMQ
jgi:lysophospholipase L1-like esterase